MQVAELLGQERDPQDALAGADEAVEARLAWALGHFPFTLDPFQVKAVRHLLAGEVGCWSGQLGLAWGGGQAAAVHSSEECRSGRPGLWRRMQLGAAAFAHIGTAILAQI